MKWSNMEDLSAGSISHPDLGRYRYRSSTTLTAGNGVRLAEVERFSNNNGSIYRVWCVAGGIEPISRVLWDGESLSEAKRIAEAMVEEANPPLTLSEVEEILGRYAAQITALYEAANEYGRTEAERISFRRQAKDLERCSIPYLAGRNKLRRKLEEEVQS